MPNQPARPARVRRQTRGSRTHYCDESLRHVARRPSVCKADPRLWDRCLALRKLRFGDSKATLEPAKLHSGLRDALRRSRRGWNFPAIERVLEVLDVGFRLGDLGDEVRAQINYYGRRAPESV